MRYFGYSDAWPHDSPPGIGDVAKHYISAHPVGTAIGIVLVWKVMGFIARNPIEFYSWRPPEWHAKYSQEKRDKR